MADKRKSFGIFKFKEPVAFKIYMKLYQSRDPVREIKQLEADMDKELIDRKAAKKHYEDLRRILLFCFAWYGLVMVQLVVL